MMTYKDLEAAVETLKRENEEFKRRFEELDRKIQGDGVIILTGNRFKVDDSGSLSDYQLKS